MERQFVELVNRISPFYQDRIKDLPPQERAVLGTMATIRTEPKTPALIAARLRKSPQQTSALLQRLTKSGYLVVMDNPDDKRSKIYRIKEGFFDLWLSMDQSRRQRHACPCCRSSSRRGTNARSGNKSAARWSTSCLPALPRSRADRLAATLDHLSDAGAADERIWPRLAWRR